MRVCFDRPSISEIHDSIITEDYEYMFYQVNDYGGFYEFINEYDYWLTKIKKYPVERTYTYFRRCTIEYNKILRRWY